jgi:hypothetical protein
MSEETIDFESGSKYRGRTWADVFVGATYITAGIIFLILVGIGIYFFVGEIPDWFFLSILASFLFVPFLMERAKDGSDLFLVADEPMKLTEYRVGRRVGIEIEGHGVQFQSKSGVYRTLLTDFDPDLKKAKGSAFAEMTQIDQVRDMNTLQRVIEELAIHLKETRISSQEIGIAVERQSIEIVDWALKTIYGAIIPTEISDAFGIESSDEKLDAKEILEPVDDEVL